MLLRWDNGMAVYAHLPQYFAEYGRKEPEAINHIPATFAIGEPELNYYEMLQKDPVRMQVLFKGMAPLEEKMPIAGIYDFSWLVAQVDDEGMSDRPLFVDVGGGGGQSIKAIHKEFSGLPYSRCVLQDRPEVIEGVVNLDEPEMREVQKMGIDFHLSQPVKGENLYIIKTPCIVGHSRSSLTFVLAYVQEH
jgi:hypothetical protein